jgi:tetratricopeptide (TPR) repeat protein
MQNEYDDKIFQLKRKVQKSFENLKKGSADEATHLSDVDSLLKMSPHDYKSLIYKGMALHDLNKYEESLLCLEHAIKRCPRNPFGYFYKGNLLKKMNREKDSMDTFKRILTSKKEPLDEAELAYEPALFAGAHAGSGDCLYQLGRYEEALESYEQALKLAGNRENCELVFERKAKCLNALERSLETVKWSVRALKIYPENCQFYFTYGTGLMQLRKFEEAANVFKRASTLNTDIEHYHGALYFMTRCLLDSKRYQEALESIDKCIVMKPNCLDFQQLKEEILKKITK